MIRNSVGRSRSFVFASMMEYWNSFSSGKSHSGSFHSSVPSVSVKFHHMQCIHVYIYQLSM